MILTKIDPLSMRREVELQELYNNVQIISTNAEDMKGQMNVEMT